MINMPKKFALARVDRVELALVLRRACTAAHVVCLGTARQLGQVLRLGPVSDVLEVMSVFTAAPGVGVVVTGIADSSRVITPRSRSSRNQPASTQSGLP